MKKSRVTIGQLRKLVEKDVIQKCEANVVAAFKEHGFTRNEIIGALMILALPYEAATKDIDPSWLEIMQTYRNNFNGLVTVLLERAADLSPFKTGGDKS